jgi:CcmD family protein
MIYVAAAYGVAWTGVCLYLIRLVRQERGLEQEVRALQTRLAQRDVAEGAG